MWSFDILETWAAQQQSVILHTHCNFPFNLEANFNKTLHLADKICDKTKHIERYIVYYTVKLSTITE